MMFIATILISFIDCTFSKIPFFSLKIASRCQLNIHAALAVNNRCCHDKTNSLTKLRENIVTRGNSVIGEIR